MAVLDSRGAVVDLGIVVARDPSVEVEDAVVLAGSVDVDEVALGSSVVDVDEAELLEFADDVELLELAEDDVIVDVGELLGLLSPAPKQEPKAPRSSAPMTRHPHPTPFVDGALAGRFWALGTARPPSRTELIHRNAASIWLNLFRS